MTEYTLIRSDRKTLAIEVKGDGTLVARAPHKMKKADIDAFIVAKEAWISSAQEKARARASSPLRTPMTKEEANALAERARDILSVRIPYWSQQTGLFPRGVKLTNAQKRFGSCSSDNRLCFALHLFRYPDDCIDYVILHEIAHIKHHNHSKTFYALLSQHMPDYKERQKRLKAL